MYLTHQKKLVFLWALYRAYREDAKGVFTTSYNEAMEETKIARNTLVGIFKQLRVLDAFTFEENDDHTFTINMSDYKDFTSMIMPILDTVLGLRAKRKKNARILYNNGKNLDKLKSVLLKTKDSKALESLVLELFKSPVLESLDSLESKGDKTHKKSSQKRSSTRTKVRDAREDILVNTIKLLNELTDSKYKTGSTNKKLVYAILAQGYNEEDLLSVVAYKCQEWKGTHYEDYLRPSTLFGDNFEAYLHSAKNYKPEKQRNKGLRL